MRAYFNSRITDRFRPGVWLGSAAVLLAGALSFGLASPASAQYYPYGPYRRTPQRRPNNTNNRRPNNNTQKTKSNGGKGTSKADVMLGSEVQALHDRHEALLAKLPYSMRILDKDAMQTVDRLPLIAQYGYLTTVEDYSTLGVADQRKLHDTMQSLASMKGTERDGYVSSAGKTFGNLQNNSAELKTARSHPHDTCFQIQDTVSAFHNPPATTSSSSVKTGSTTTTTTSGSGTTSATSNSTSTTGTTADKPKKKKPATPDSTTGTTSSSGASNGSN